MSNLQELKIHEAIKHIESNQYILPSIQREFVWKEKQICFLFDSLMRGYPISTFQFWKLPPERSKKLELYFFLKVFDRFNNQHLCKPAPKNFWKGKHLTAVLDGQQRLTALYLGLKGEIYTSPRNMRKGGLMRGQPKHLYLNLLNDTIEDEEDDSLKYEFKFLSQKQIATAEKKNETLWFRVGMVSEEEDKTKQWSKINKWVTEKIREREWSDDSKREQAEEKAIAHAHELHSIIRTEAKIFHYDVDEEEIETALQIFVRLNDQGQKLSKTDLLLSIATVHWGRNGPNGEKSAREAVNQLVLELEKACLKGKFGKDFVMRAALFVCDTLEVKLKTEYFTRKNMLLLRKNWEKIHKCLIETAIILNELQLPDLEKALASHNSLLPIALFLMTYDLSEGCLGRKAKNQIRKWLLLSNLKPRVWDGFKHTEVTSLKEDIKRELKENESMYKAGQEFPLEPLKKFMEDKSSSIDLNEDDYDELLAKSYRDAQTAWILDYIMPMRGQTQVDHIVPTVVLKQDFLKKYGLSGNSAKECIRQGDTLVNLQLLPVDVNTSKQGKLPLDWIEDQEKLEDPHNILTCSTVTKLWPDRSEIPGEVSINKIPDFFDARKDLVRRELMQKLGA